MSPRRSGRVTVAVLGNCVAQRLQVMLPRYPGFNSGHAVAPLPMIHTLTREDQWRETADAALACDVILTQPLFGFGPCNTEALRARLRPGQRLGLFSSPHFEAYFPDAMSLRGKVNLKFPPVLDWDSSIIFSCFRRRVPIFEVEALYRGHALFSGQTMRGAVAASLEAYAGRERGLDLPTGPYVFRHYADVKLLHTPRHPVDAFLRRILEAAAAWLGLAAEAPGFAVEGFGFNQWPVIIGGSDVFRFPEQAYFVVGGTRFSLEDVAMAYYNFYEFHPHVVEANQDRVIAV